jgi:hypothetical protein
MNIYLTIILSSPSGSSKWSLPHVSPLNPCIRLSSSPYALHAPPISFFSVCSPNIIGWAVHIIKLIILYFSLFPCYLIVFSTKYSHQHPILKHPQPVSPSVWANNFQTYVYKTSGKIVIEALTEFGSSLITVMDAVWCGALPQFIFIRERTGTVHSGWMCGSCGQPVAPGCSEIHGPSLYRDTRVFNHLQLSGSQSWLLYRYNCEASVFDNLSQFSVDVTCPMFQAWDWIV